MSKEHGDSTQMVLPLFESEGKEEGDSEPIVSSSTEGESKDQDIPVGQIPEYVAGYSIEERRVLFKRDPLRPWDD